MHKEYSFLPGSLKRFIKKYQITFDYLQVPPEMICRKQDHPGQKFFLLTLRRPGAIMKTPFSQGAAVREWPSIEQTLTGLGSDIMLTLTHRSSEEYALTFGYDPDDEDTEKEWATLQYITEKMKEFLGPEGFDEFVAMAQKGFEMGGFALGGDRIWLRQGQGTCG